MAHLCDNEPCPRLDAETAIEKALELVRSMGLDTGLIDVRVHLAEALERLHAWMETTKRKGDSDASKSDNH
jgi:hypothetical protein